MINYANEKSEYYDLNREYCLQIEAIADKYKGDYTGFCNSYGYEVNLNYKDKDTLYELEFSKSQSTQNGVIIPRDSLIYVGVKLSATFNHKVSSIEYGKSKLKRLFMNSQDRGKIPDGYYFSIKGNKNARPEDLISILTKSNFDFLKTNENKLTAKMHLTGSMPDRIIADFLSFTENIKKMI